MEQQSYCLGGCSTRQAEGAVQSIDHPANLFSNCHYVRVCSQLSVAGSFRLHICIASLAWQVPCNSIHVYSLQHSLPSLAWQVPCNSICVYSLHHSLASLTFKVPCNSIYVYSLHHSLASLAWQVHLCSKQYILPGQSIWPRQTVLRMLRIKSMTKKSMCFLSLFFLHTC